MIRVLLFIFIWSITFDPTGILHIKELLFVFLLGWAIKEHLKKPQKIPVSVLLVITSFLIFPIYALLNAQISENCQDFSYAIGHIKSILFILFYFVIVRFEFDYIYKLLVYNGLLLVVATLMIHLFFLVYPDIFNYIYTFFRANGDIAIISRREFLGVVVNGIYFKTAPFIIFSYIYVLYSYKGRGRMLLSLMTLYTLLISGSRVPMLIAVLITILYLYRTIKISRLIKYTSFFITFIAFISVVYFLATEEGETSNVIKFGNLNSYLSDIFNLKTFLFGAGLGSTFYAEGIGEYISNSELTYMDLWRIYGTFITLILLLCVFSPCIKMQLFLRKKEFPKQYYRFAEGYGLYMILAGTNPLLLSSTGMFVLALGLLFITFLRQKVSRIKLVSMNEVK